MKVILAGAGRRFLHAAAAAFIILAIGVLNAPNLDASSVYIAGVIFLVAILAAAWKVVQEVIPAFSWASLGVPQPIAAWLDAFTQAAFGALVVTVPGLLEAPDLGTARALATAALIGAFTAGFRALEGLLTPGESPVPGMGVSSILAALHIRLA